MTQQHKTYFNYLCGIIPASILVIPAAGELAFALIALYSLVYCYQQKINPFTSVQTQVISYICLFYFASALLSILASDLSLYAFKRLGTNIHFLFAPWLAGLLAKNLNQRSLSSACKIGALLAGLVALTQYFYLGLRAHGTVNAIPFGDITLLLSFFSIINMHHESKQQKYFSLLSFILGISGVIFSLSRGAWVTLPFLLIMLLFLWYQQKVITLKSLVLLSLIGSMLIATAGFTPQVQSRLHAIKQDIQAYEHNKLTSVGQRIALWEVAMKAIPTHPILGFGLHNKQQVPIDFLENEDLKQSLHQLGHFHNEYLTTLVTKGSIGLISLLLLLLAPGFLFYPSLLSTQHHFLASLIFLLTTGYASFGLTNLAFGHGIMNTFFVFILAAATAATPSNSRSMLT